MPKIPHRKQNGTVTERVNRILIDREREIEKREFEKK